MKKCPQCNGTGWLKPPPPPRTHKFDYIHGRFSAARCGAKFSVNSEVLLQTWEGVTCRGCLNLKDKLRPPWKVELYKALGIILKDYENYKQT